MRRPALVGSLVLGCMPLLACGASDRTADVVVTDSAGIRIIEYGDVSEREAPFVVADEPIYRIGWDAGGHEFGFVQAVAVLSDGRAVIADRDAVEVVVISPTGVVEDTIGREGDGPGEFRQIHGLTALAGDTFVVQDMRLNRVSFFHDDRLVRDSPLGSLSRLTVLGRGNGTLLMGMPLTFVMGMRYAEPWLEVPLVVYDPAAEEADTLSLAEWNQSIDYGGNDPFASEGFAAVSRGDFVVGRGDRTELRWIDADAALTRIVRWQTPRRPVTDSLWDLYDAGMRRWFGERLPPQSIEERMRSLREAAGDSLPVFGDVLADPAGNIWLPEYQHVVVARPTTYYVVSPDGEWLGSVSVPPGIRMLAIGEDRLVGVQRNDFDVEAVVAYALRRSEAEAVRE